MNDKQIGWSALIASIAALSASCGGANLTNTAAQPVSGSASAPCEDAAHAHAARQRYAEAAAAATRCAELAPGDADARDTQGEMLLLAGQLDAAEQAFQTAQRLRNGFALAYQGLASVRFHRGDHAGGEAALRAGIALTPEIDPSYARTRLTEDLAVAHFLAGREAEAFEAMGDSVRAQNLDASTTAAVTHVGRARLLLQAGRWDRVATELQAARVPGAQSYVDSAIRALEIRAWVGAGDVTRATAALTTLTRELGDTHPRVLEPAFAVALAQGDLARAASRLPRMVEVDPYAAEAAELDLARALRNAGQERDARAVFEKIARRFQRSAASAHVRRTAEDSIHAGPRSRVQQ